VGQPRDWQLLGTLGALPRVVWAGEVKYCIAKLFSNGVKVRS
jgi:hypothetical protein